MITGLLVGAVAVALLLASARDDRRKRIADRNAQEGQ